MKIQYMSDLHLEFAPLDIPNEDRADVLVLAGDICVADFFTRSLASPYSAVAEMFGAFFEMCSKRFDHVVYVMGNHEHYHGNLVDTLPVLNEQLMAYPNIHLLDNTSVAIDDVIFVGGTMWTNFNGGNPLDMEHARSMMNDYRLIKNVHRKMLPVDTFNKHVNTVRFIEKIADTNDKVVVVSHHAPSTQSICRLYKGDVLNPAYASNMEEFILEHPTVKLWFHGHLHSTSDYMIGETRVLANPRGYNGENPEFNVVKTVTL